MHGHADHLFAEVTAFYPRWLDVARQRCHCIHTVLHIVQELLQVHAGPGTDLQSGKTLGGCRGDAFDVVEVIERFLDTLHDLLLDFLRGCPRPGDLNLDLVDLKAGKGFAFHAHETEGAGEQNAHHQQVGSDRVVYPPANKCAHSAVPGFGDCRQCHTLHRIADG